MLGADVTTGRGYGQEFAAINGDQIAFDQACRSAKLHKRAARCGECGGVVFAEVGDGFEVRREAVEQPHDFDVVLAFGLKPARRPYVLEVTVGIEFEQVCGVVGRTSVAFGAGFIEPQNPEIKARNIGIDDPDQMVFGITSSMETGNRLVWFRDSPWMYAVTKMPRIFRCGAFS